MSEKVMSFEEALHNLSERQPGCEVPECFSCADNTAREEAVRTAHQQALDAAFRDGAEAMHNKVLAVVSPTTYFDIRSLSLPERGKV
jgi:hypothetical protein